MKKNENFLIVIISLALFPFVANEMNNKKSKRIMPLMNLTFYNGIKRECRLMNFVIFFCLQHTILNSYGITYGSVY